jgi:hypothetical protein
MVPHKTDFKHHRGLTGLIEEVLVSNAACEDAITSPRKSHKGPITKLSHACRIRSLLQSSHPHPASQLVMSVFPTASSLPPLNIPPSNAVVKVSVIDTTTHVKGLPTSLFFEPAIKGYDVLDCPAYCFLIEHEASGKKLLFDLGVPKDWRNGLAPIGQHTLAN